MTEETEVRTVYEIGFHLIPRLTEDEVPSHVDEIKSVLDKAGAEIISEEFPTLIDLAYAISATVSGNKEEFDTAHFGWIKFEADPAVIEELDESVRAKQEVLRFIIVKTLREDTVVRPEEPEEVEAPEAEETESAEPTAEPTEETAETETEEETPRPEGEGETETPKGEDEVDKAIDELVSDPTKKE